MGLLDYFADRSFRDDPAGRVVVFTGDSSKRGYLVRSPADELKIRSFLKMFVAAQLSIQFLGLLLANAWSMGISHEMGRPAEHIVKITCIYLAIYSLVVGVPFALLWRSFKRERFRFVSPQDEVAVTSKPAKDPRSSQLVWVTAIAALIVLGIAAMLAARVGSLSR
jgi:hypothetical protein